MTIYDIAKIAGVSASSVSRVINSKPGVNPETRQRVLKTIEKYNYSPNAVARGLVCQTTKTVGILVADIRNIHHTEGAYHIEQELMAAGYCCIILNTGTEDQDKVNAIQILSRRRVDGIVMMGSTFQSDAVQQAVELYLQDRPVVLVNGWLDCPDTYGILTDDQGGVLSCVQYLMKRGRKRIAFVQDDDNTPSNQQKKAGYQAGAAQLGLDFAQWTYIAENSLEGGEEATQRLLKDHPDVDGIVYAVDLLAAGGLHALRREGISVPGQVSVIGVDDSDYARICTPTLTSLDTKNIDVGLMAARIVMDHLNGKHNTRRVMVLPDLVVREST